MEKTPTSHHEHKDSEIGIQAVPTSSNMDAKELMNAAAAATDSEHRMTIWEAIKAYPKAVMFSVIISTSLVMEGYDTALLGNFYALPQFNRRYGVPVGNGTYQLTPAWQGGLQNGTQVGQILGLMIAGAIADRFGYKKTFIGAHLMMIAVIFLFFFAKNIGMLFAAELIAGFPWGAFQTLATTYAADVAPIAIRPMLTSYSNICWVLGQLISVGVLRGFVGRDDEWAYRVPFALQWVWPVPIIIGILFAPESPNWLVKVGRLEDARASLRKLAAKDTPSEAIDQKLAMINYTNELELEENGSGTSYLDCLKGTNRRRTEISCVVWVSQVFCGIWFGGNVSYFLSLTGKFTSGQSFNLGLGSSCLALVATCCAWFLCDRIGRRTLFLCGLGFEFTVLMIIGFLGIPHITTAIGYATGVLMMLYVVSYQLTVGPITYCLVAEIPSSRLRIKTTVLARNSYNVAALCANFLNPPILNPLGWDLHGKGGFVWAGFCLSVLTWTYFRLPEPKGLSPAELDVLFEQKVSARKFKKAQPQVFNAEIAVQAVASGSTGTAQQTEKV